MVSKPVDDFVFRFCTEFAKHYKKIHSLSHKSNFAGHVIIATGLRRMHFRCPGIILRWNLNLWQVDFAWTNILGVVALAGVTVFLTYTCDHSHLLYFSVYIFGIWKFKNKNHILRLRS